MCRLGSSALAGLHNTATTKQAPRATQDRAIDAIIGAILENRRMAKALMIPRGIAFLGALYVWVSSHSVDLRSAGTTCEQAYWGNTAWACLPCGGAGNSC